ncbi:hypothetical protein [Brachybacterium hainanense]|uniref:Secreted protein n=1 Tax=Brachybacterium hainanense TaxID=1541174 RepID=A0ABV6R813_9MICO
MLIILLVLLRDLAGRLFTPGGPRADRPQAAVIRPLDGLVDRAAETLPEASRPWMCPIWRVTDPARYRRECM